MTRLAAVLVLAAALGLPARAAAATAQPPIRHVWVIQLENHSYDETFNDAARPYLWTKLRAIGQILPQFHATGHASLDR